MGALYNNFGRSMRYCNASPVGMGVVMDSLVKIRASKCQCCRSNVLYRLTPDDNHAIDNVDDMSLGDVWIRLF